MATCDPQALLNAANCFDCLTNQQLEQVQVQMLCDLVNGGLAGGPFIPVSDGPFVRISGDTMTGELDTPFIGIGKVTTAPGFSTDINIQKNISLSGAISYNSLNVYNNWIGGTTGSFRSAYFGTFLAGNGAQNYNIVNGQNNEVYLGLTVVPTAVTAWSGQATFVIASDNYLNNITSSTGLVVNAMGGRFQVDCSATGIIRSAIGCRIETVKSSGVEAFAHNAYGLYIDNSISASGGSSNDSYSIYSLSTSPSLLTGSLGLGTSVPKSKLDIVGNLTVGATYGGVNAAPTSGAIIEGRVGIGTNAPAATALLDLVSTTLGFKLPNMTTNQKNAIANTAGLMVFDTDLGKACVNNGAGWQTITSV